MCKIHKHLFKSQYFNPAAASLTGVNIGGAGSYVYDAPANNNASPTSVDSVPKAEEKRVFAPKAAPKGKRAASGFAAALMSNGEPLVDGERRHTCLAWEINKIMLSSVFSFLSYWSFLYPLCC